MYKVQKISLDNVNCLFLRLVREQRAILLSPLTAGYHNNTEFSTHEGEIGSLCSRVEGLGPCAVGWRDWVPVQ